MEEYISTLSTEDKASVKEEDSVSTFRFGDGIECYTMLHDATRCITVPVKIGNVKYRLRVEIVELIFRYS